jgi:NADH-quinone oxidoreductase subunit J
MSAVLFFIAASGVIAGAVGVVVLRNPFYSVLALVGHLVSLAVLFLLLRAEFVAAVQVVVYAGAVMVLYVFVVAYVGGEADSIGERLRGFNGSGGHGSTGGSGSVGSGLRLGGAVLGGALLVELLIALLGTGLEATSGYGAGYVSGPQTYGTPAYIGKLLLTRFLLAFELASFLLLIAAVGGVVLARRRGGIGEVDEHETFAPLDLLRPRGTGTTAEGVGSVPGGGQGRADRVRESRVQTGAGHTP